MAYKKLKDWFDKALAILLSEKIQPVFQGFDSQRFIREIDTGIHGLELKARVELIADILREHLPQDYPQSISILTAVLGPENEKETGMFTEGYWIMPIAKYVEKYGVEHYSESIAAIREITTRHTGEYCIRPFLERYPDKTLAVMGMWSRDENVHVRRLASEGLRPRLPWARKLDQFIANPEPILQILENLKDDDSKFVQKSVANNIHDILKDNYQIGLQTLERWSQDPTRARQWIIKHALRNHIKQGNPEAIRLVERC
ncbi:3-methyladenine DNA glycosylase [candidate division KSB3 bacterium]|uniref:3-methyladenine DNA glycosylase n=1 Tax=candidate division KSB3 bacterium TaxID=2044937 RepID=A0A2G6KFE7_9BACT|nr:MAG: 3-methyladenine DNA glycosylase [candidate division KSB3 bacterium]